MAVPTAARVSTRTFIFGLWSCRVYNVDQDVSGITAFLKPIPGVQVLD